MCNRWLVFDIETTGLDPMKDLITTISMTDEELDSQTEIIKSADEEAKLLSWFLKKVNERPLSSLVTKNGKKFDVPFIICRSIVHKLPLLDIYTAFASKKHIDLQELTKGWVKLDDMATLMRLGSNKTMTGLMAITVWKNAVGLEEKGEHERASRLFDTLKDYCMTDVMLTMEIALKHKLIRMRE